MSSDLKKLFGGVARVREGALSPGKVKKMKKPIEPSLPPVKKPPTVEEVAVADEDDFASMFDEPDEEVVKFSEAVDGTLQDKKLGALARAKEKVEEDVRFEGVYLPPPQEELDLHGMTAAQAELRVEAYVIDAHRRKLIAIRIITGKGQHSPRGPVLPEVVATILKKMKNRGLVTMVRHDKKGGSVRVYLAP